MWIRECIYLHLHWAKIFVHLILEEISVYSTEICALDHEIVHFCEHGPVLKHTRRPMLVICAGACASSSTSESPIPF